MMMARHAMATRSAGSGSSSANSVASAAPSSGGAVAVADAVAVASSTASAAAEAAAAAAAAAVASAHAAASSDSAHTALSAQSALPMSSAADAASVVASRHRGLGLRSSSLLAMVSSANAALPSHAPAGPAATTGVSGAPPIALRSHKAMGRPHSSKFGTVNYSTDEMRRLVDKVRAVMPVSTEDWLHVAYQFNYMRPESIPYREVESLKRKFKKMYCSRASGNAKLPDYVVEAKELRRLINQRTDVSTSAAAAAPAELTCAPLEETTKRSHASDAATPTPPASAVSEEGATEDSGRELSVPLGGMEDEYNASSAALSRRSPANSVNAGTPDAWSGNSVAVDSTSGIINLLRHSIERKRRTVEEQLLSESERVRKERKKRKMEQALYNIHREHEMMASSTTAPSTMPPSSIESSSSGVDGTFASMATANAASSPAFPSLLGPQAYGPSALQTDASSLGVMEVLLQFMLVQQHENMRRWQEMEDYRRKAEAVARRRRRADARRRRRDKHELMALMARLFQGDFPDELKKYVDPAYIDGSSDENGDEDYEDDEEATSDGDNAVAPPASTTGDPSSIAAASINEHSSVSKPSEQAGAASAASIIVTDVVL
ncbi:hypothetical protein P43SY_005064 [Pythium insidiosum]|uniref:DUF6818 domain-containing protein n=1 Tax=Pythium insidiosum TaxID=114742 RepID=A0AAD5MF54_PYTIN|nr:hypothetical protein P43SY_005064 [Pythium insidiosum]